MLYVLLLVAGLWSLLQSFVPQVLVPLISGTSWPDWSEKSRESATFYGLCIWAGWVNAVLFHAVLGRPPENWEAIVASVLALLWINLVTMPFLAETKFWLPWSPCDEEDVCGQHVVSGVKVE